jgi:hypothetical protein
MAETSRWPLNIWLWKNEAGTLVPGNTLVDFTTTMNNFDEARRLICDKLNHEGYACGVIWTDATASPEEAYRSGHRLEDMQSQRIELHYRAFDDPFRGRIVTGGMCTAKEADEFVVELKKEYKKRVLTPNELYALKSIDGGCIEWIEKWLSEENVSLDYRVWEHIEKTGLVKLRYLANEVMGSDESFEIATVWFASNPVAVVTHTGEDKRPIWVLASYVFEQIWHRPHSEVDPDEFVARVISVREGRSGAILHVIVHVQTVKLTGGHLIVLLRLVGHVVPKPTVFLWNAHTQKSFSS